MERGSEHDHRSGHFDAGAAAGRRRVMEERAVADVERAGSGAGGVVAGTGVEPPPAQVPGKVAVEAAVADRRLLRPQVEPPARRRNVAAECAVEYLDAGAGEEHRAAVAVYFVVVEDAVADLHAALGAGEVHSAAVKAEHYVVGQAAAEHAQPSPCPLEADGAAPAPGLVRVQAAVDDAELAVVGSEVDRPAAGVRPLAAHGAVLHENRHAGAHHGEGSAPHLLVALVRRSVLVEGGVDQREPAPGAVEDQPAESAPEERGGSDREVRVGDVEAHARHRDAGQVAGVWIRGDEAGVQDGNVEIGPVDSQHRPAEGIAEDHVFNQNRGALRGNAKCGWGRRLPCYRHGLHFKMAVGAYFYKYSIKAGVPYGQRTIW